MGKYVKLALIKKCILALLIGSAFVACVGDIGSSLMTNQANRLLTADSVKVWNRVARVENNNDVELVTCDDSRVLVLLNLATDLDTLFMYDRAFGCSVLDTLLVMKANYEVVGDVDEQFLNRLELSNETPSDFGSFTILDITSRYLKLQYNDGDAIVIESYIFEESQ